MAAKAKSRAKKPAKKAVRSGRASPPGTPAARGNGAARDLLARLTDGAVVCAEGYVFELERRGYLQAGAFVPEVLFEHPEVVEQLHTDFVHAGSDVTQALTYYVHREKLRVIGREKDLAPMNRAALGIAKRVARRTGTLFAGDLCNTNIYDPADSKAIKDVERIFDEQVGWAVEAGVDYFVAETLGWVGEALIALKAIRRQSKVPVVVTFAMHQEELTREGLPRNPRSWRSGIPVVVTGWRSPTGWIRSWRRARRSSTLDARRSRPASAISGCAVVQALITSVRSPRVSAAIHRRAATARTWPSTPSSAPTR